MAVISGRKFCKVWKIDLLP